MAARPDIVLWDKILSAREMAALYRSAGAFVLPSHGEGWGRPYMEAMACGLPTIGTGASGNVDFMTDANSLLVPAALAEIPAEAAREFPLFRGHRWFEPDRTELRRMMRQVASDPDLRQRIGSQAAEDVRRDYCLEAVARVVEAAIQAAESRVVAQDAPPVEPRQIRVVLEGELFCGHSFSNINEQLCLNLGNDPTLAISVQRVRHALEQGQPHHAYRVRPFIDRPLPGGPQVTIRHAYPPNWTPPERGLWVHIQPWEYGHLPIDWLEPLRDQVDEIWAPSQYVRRVYERSGVPAEKIQVIPWGADPDVFTPTATPLLLATAKTFRFLFVGGTISRKGFDRLLEAYLAEFGPDEDVCLVVKDVGADSVYRHANFRELARAAQRDPNQPAILYLDRPMTPEKLASLYTACQCFVAPYRGEGFGLPILEAMGCGLAPIVPRGGASDDFVPDQTAYLLDSAESEVQGMPGLCGPQLELSIRQEHLRERMREAFEHRDQTRDKGGAAAKHVHGHFRWSDTARRITVRIHALIANDKHASRPASREVAGRITRRATSLCALVAADGDPRILAGTLASLHPFAERIVCVADHLNETATQVAREYGAHAVEYDNDGLLLRTIADTRCDWLLKVRAGERPDEEGLRRLPLLLESLPKDVASVGVQVARKDNQGRTIHRQVELRLVRSNGKPADSLLPLDREWPFGDRKTGRFAQAELEIAVPLALDGGEEPAEAEIALSEPWLAPWLRLHGDIFLDVGANVGHWARFLAPGYR